MELSSFHYAFHPLGVPERAQQWLGHRPPVLRLGDKEWWVLLLGAALDQLSCGGISPPHQGPSVWAGMIAGRQETASIPVLLLLYLRKQKLQVHRHKSFSILCIEWDRIPALAGN